MSAAADDELLHELVAKAMELHDRDGRVDYEGLCGSRWDLIDEVRASVEASVELHEPANPDPMLGRLFADRYTLTQRLGAGAMGVVYRADDRQLDRPVAIKILRAAILGEQEAHARFEREAEAMAAIRHPSIAGVHDRGVTEGGDVFLVMELLDGRSLADLLDEAEQRRDRMDDDTAWIRDYLAADAAVEPSFVRTAVTWAAQLAEGLQAAHEAGIVHRDVKPSNVFVRSDGVPVLLDFGIAARQNQETLAESDRALGTPAYMAPEALADANPAGPRIDVYGLSATLYHLLTLRPPFRGTPSQVLHALTRKDPTPAYRLRPGLPRDLQAILDRGMARPPQHRYASAAEFGADLRAFLAYRPVTARPISAATRALRTLRRSPAARAGIAVATLAALLVGGVLGYDELYSEWERDYWSTWRLLPPNTTLVHPSNRKVHAQDERSYVLGILDASVQKCLQPVPARAVRAAFLLDQGELQACRRDMRAIADELGSALSRQLADRYDALADVQAGGVALDDLPPPASAQDALLLAFQHLRVRALPEVEALLSRDDLRDDRTAEQWRLLLQMDGVRRAADPAAAAHALYDSIARFEARLGMMTAQTAHLGAYAMLMQGLYPDCYERANEGLKLSPFGYHMRLNGGLAARRVGRTDAALAMLEGARAQRPDYPKTYWSMFQVCMDLPDLERAAAVLASAEHLESERGQLRVLTMRGMLDAARAITSYERGAPDDGRRHARDACAWFEQAAGFGDVSTSYWPISKALAVGDTSTVFRELVDDLVERPIHWRHLQDVQAWMPDPLTGKDREALHTLLEAVALQLSQAGSGRM